jgi:ABC-type phosphate/phosphonate transport system ATPase subunit
MSPVLVGSDLHKSFGHTHALRGASVTIDEGEIVAVMGPSGSGKSTLPHSPRSTGGCRGWASTGSAAARVSAV